MSIQKQQKGYDDTQAELATIRWRYDTELAFLRYAGRACYDNKQVIMLQVKQVVPIGETKCFPKKNKVFLLASADGS